MTNYIFGNNSMVGSAVIHSLDAEFRTIGRTGNPDIHLDLLDQKKESFSFLNRDDKIVFCAAVSSPQVCASNVSVSNSINIFATYNAVKEMLSRGCWVLFFSSDVVYENASGPNNEISDKAPQNIYALQKSIIEESFKEEERFIVYRASYIFGKHDKFLRYMFGCYNSGTTVEVFGKD